MESNLDEHQDDSGSRPYSRRLGVLFLGSEWGSSKGGLSTINRELAINVAKLKDPEVDVTFFVPRCNERDQDAALGHKIKLVAAKELIGMEEPLWLCCPPSDLHFDVVVGHGVPLGPQANLISKLFKCKWVQVVHTIPEELGMYKDYSNPVSNAQEKHKTELQLCQEADFVVSIGPKLNEAFHSYLAWCNKGEMFLNFTPGILSEFSEIVHDSERPTTKFRVLLLSRGDVEDFSVKGLDIAAKAVSGLNVCLYFVGPQRERLEEVKNRLLEYGIHKNNLVVRKFLEIRGNLKKLFSEVDLVIMPSRTEGFGLTGLEALSAGLPVLVSRNSGFGEALSEIRYGSHFVVDSDDSDNSVQDWAKAIEKLRTKKKGLRLEESKELRSSYAKTYNSEKQCKELIGKITSVIQAERTQAPRGANSERQLREMLQREENSQRPLRDAQQPEDHLQRQLQQREENEQVQSKEIRKRKASSRSQLRDFKPDTQQRKDGSQGNVRENFLPAIHQPGQENSQRQLREAQQPEDHLQRQLQQREENEQLQSKEIKKRKASSNSQLRDFKPDTQQRKDGSQGNLKKNFLPAIHHPEQHFQRQSKKMQQPKENEQVQLRGIKKSKASSSSQLRDFKQDTQQRRDGSRGNLRENFLPAIHHPEQHLLRQSKKMQQPKENEQVQLEEIKKGSENSPTQLKEMQQREENLQTQLREVQQREENLQTQLREVQQSEENLQTQLMEMKQREENSQTQLREVQQREENLQTQLREVQQSRENSQRQLKEMKQREENSRGQLTEMQQREENLQTQLREVQQSRENSQRQLKEMQQREENSQRQQLTEMQQREEHLQTQLREVQQREENLQTQLREVQQREENLQTQLREVQQSEENLQTQLREMKQREENSQMQLREMEQREENSQRQLMRVQQREENLQRRLIELQEQLEIFQGQVSTLETQVIEKDEEVSELMLTLSSAQDTISEQQKQETCDWVISRDEIQMTDKSLGRGGWGSVYEGVYCGCTVAVKQIHELLLSSHSIRLFEREMNIASKCRHPHLLQFIGATNDKGTPLFVTELMEKSLRALLEQRDLSKKEIAVISLDVALALNYLHQKKPVPIIHRDVNSANVLLWRQGDQWRAKVSDYGTVNFMQQTMTMAPGAMTYSAPEALSSNQTPKLDVYSFGVLLCEMCIGQFPDPDKREEQFALMTNRPLRGLVRRCLQRDPEARPTMQEIIDELSRAVYRFCQFRCL